MVQTGDSGRSRRGGQGQGILSDVDQQKRQKFKNRLNEFRNQREWSRDTFERDLKDLNNVIETVEELITDIQVKIRKKEGKGDYTGDIARIKQEYGKSDLDELQSMGNGSFTPYLKEIADVWKELSELKDQRDQWIAYQSLLHEVAKNKLAEITHSYKNDRIDSEVAERLMDYIDDQNTRFQENAEKDLKSMIREQVSEVNSDVQKQKADIERLESRVERAEEETKRQQEITQILAEALGEEVKDKQLIKDIKQEIEGIESSNDNSGDDGFPRSKNGVPNHPETQDNQVEEELGENFVDDEPEKRPSPSPEPDPEPASADIETQEDDSTPDGVDEDELQNQFDTDSSDEDSDDDVVEEALEEMQEEDETDPEDVDVAELRGKTPEEQYEELKRVRESFSDEEWNSMSQSDIADLTDASRPYLINEILEAVHDEYDTAFGITDRYNDE